MDSGSSLGFKLGLVIHTLLNKEKLFVTSDPLNNPFFSTLLTYKNYFFQYNADFNKFSSLSQQNSWKIYPLLLFWNCLFQLLNRSQESTYPVFIINIY